VREPELVARDVRDGKVSVARAREIYRVAVSAEGIVDQAATARLRK
jgi:N-methylhydantoinase B